MALLREVAKDIVVELPPDGKDKENADRSSDDEDEYEEDPFELKTPYELKSSSEKESQAPIYKPEPYWIFPMRPRDDNPHVARMTAASRRHATQTEAKVQSFHDRIGDLVHAFLCPVCHEHSKIPKILECGHGICESCCERMDSIVSEGAAVVAAAEAAQAAADQAPPGASQAAARAARAAAQAMAQGHSVQRKCPMCRANLLGPPYPCLQGKSLASAIASLQEYHEALLLPVGESKVAPSVRLSVALGQSIAASTAVAAGGAAGESGLMEEAGETQLYLEETTSSRELFILQAMCLQQVKLAETAARMLLLRLSPQNLTDGIYVQFGPETTHRFVYAFGVEMHQMYHCHVQYDNQNISMLVRYNVVSMTSITVIIQPPTPPSAQLPGMQLQKPPQRYALPAPICPPQLRARFSVKIVRGVVLISELVAKSPDMVPEPVQVQAPTPSSQTHEMKRTEVSQLETKSQG